MTLTPKHLKDVCLLNDGDKKRTCRYLCNDELDENKWYCQKHCLEVKADIDKSIDLAGKKSRIPSGDNCPGYPLLKHTAQGYDLD